MKKIWPIAFEQYTDRNNSRALWASDGRYYYTPVSWYNLPGEQHEPTDYRALELAQYKVIGIVIADGYCFVKDIGSDELFFMKRDSSKLRLTDWSMKTIIKTSDFVPGPELFVPNRTENDTSVKIAEAKIVKPDFKPISSSGECYWHRFESCKHRID